VIDEILKIVLILKEHEKMKRREQKKENKTKKRKEREMCAVRDVQ
jgi:hypothetical protein